jgi:hypothetical protein
MMPTLAPAHNPWLHLYLPVALQEPRTREKSCLFFAIMATSAFSKAQLSPQSRALHAVQAREFRDKAEALLEQIVEGLSGQASEAMDSSNKQALLAAALTMTSVEV